MNEINRKLLELNNKIVETLNELAEFTPRFYHVFKNGKLKGYSSQLTNFRKALTEIDHSLEPHTKIPGDITSVKMVSGQLSVTFSIRNLTLTSLDEAQKMLSSYEGQAGFKLSTTLSLIAIVISTISLVG
ncbi:hypothetical protein tinsulaeT_35670 [Thalassotalea insulae]|uniref:Methyl-accepting chemotaxis protein n=1 Tax=Thalassotalea insulae TaxID=2056778 RepID=A0ABQ6GY16_9GAMM|nr:hypothetical protein [Thalassotalea insulae]GLX80227.1 hypothetical protein tinsulaeT_35670 [Thalassotalea insulae]